MNDVHDLRVLFGTDFHFGSRRTPAVNTMKCVRYAWPDTSEMSLYDVFFIGGDWMDRLVNLGEVNAYIAQEAAIYLLKLCKKHNIKLRVVEGTCSHDRRQSIQFTELNIRLEIGCDVAYYQELAIEYFPEWDLSVLYLPDEWHHDATETLNQAKHIIRKNGRETVDLAIVHGGFNYQIPLPLPSLHDEVAWSELVNYAVLSGHIHEHSRCLKVICAGSFDRNGHGEDSPKGHIALHIAERKIKSIKFIENPYAKVYKSIVLHSESFVDIKKSILSLGNLPDGSAIRLEYQPPYPIKAVREKLETVFPRYLFSDIRRNDKAEKDLRPVFSKTVFQPVEITRSSVVKLVVDRMAKRGIPGTTLALAAKVIEETLE